MLTIFFLPSAISHPNTSSTPAKSCRFRILTTPPAFGGSVAGLAEPALVLEREARRESASELLLSDPHVIERAIERGAASELDVVMKQ